MARSDLIQRLKGHADAASAFADKIGSTGVYRQYADDLAEAVEALEESGPRKSIPTAGLNVLTTKQAAAATGISISTLRRVMGTPKGPPVVRLSARRLGIVRITYWNGSSGV